MTVDCCSVTAVCARMRPLTEAPETSATFAAPRIIPSNTEPAPRVTEPETTQKTFEERAPPARMVFAAAA